MVTRKKSIKRTAEVAAIDNSVDSDDGASQPKVPKELLVIAQEVKFVRALACNDLVKRNRQLRKLRKWFQLRARSSFPFTEDDFMRLWKGLYYNMWMSDKPLVQEDLAEQLGQMVDSFSGNTDCSLAYFSAFMRTMCQEWFGIDQWRMDKFLMLVRRMLRYMLRLLKQNKWAPELIQTFNTDMEKSVMAEQPKSRGLTMHYMDIFFEELAKAANGEITSAEVNLFLRPFVSYMGTQRDAKLTAQCRTRVLYHLLYQSDLGREYTDKYNAWKDMGFPTASIDDVEKLDSGFDEEDDENEQSNERTLTLDPRAGDVDVHMPELPLNADCVLDELQTLLRTHEYNSKRRKSLRKLQQIFETYKGGEFPLGVRSMPKVEGESLGEMFKKKVIELNEMEDEVFGTGRKLKKLSKAKRKRLLQSINFEEVDEDNYDEIIGKALSPELEKQAQRNAKLRSTINNGWLVEQVDEAEQEKPQENEQPTAKKIKKSNAKQSTVETKKQNPRKEHADQKSAEPTVAAKKQKKSKLDKEQEPSQGADITTEAQTKPTTKSESDKTEVEAITNAKAANGWEAPLETGELEYFVPSRKQQLKRANNSLVLNPVAVAVKSTPKAATTAATERIKFATPSSSGSAKRVRIVTKRNSIHPTSDYLRQLKLSPQLPYDADRQPGKSALKPHVLPGPINPNFKGAKLSFNDTL
ncbi:ribosomal RNA processing protein 1 homolog [Scaptodrosophila lebanonensis]|uniref:Ribosomal RNA processing protein 1 homolog n=1 Tax=Drosophila lebanonensis TaxID=7225 RepID=A0A6J2TMK5_DROLE|nr:ribosomal RNA processing protein 1 homolog [Scaptodrosophila lebanonensis]